MESAPTRSRTHPNIPRRITHPDLPKGQPILTFPKGRNKLLCFVKDFFRQSYQPPPSLPRRGGTDTIAFDKPLIIRRLLTIILLARVSVPPLRGEVRWGLMSFNQSNLFLPLGKVRMGCTKIPPTLS